MTVTKKCELLAGDYLFLRDKLKDLHHGTVELKNKEQIESLANAFILTWLGPPTSDVVYPNISKATLRRLEQRLRDAVKEPLDRIPLEVDASIAEFQDEMWQKVVVCECGEAKAIEEELGKEALAKILGHPTPETVRKQITACVREITEGKK